MVAITAPPTHAVPEWLMGVRFGCVLVALLGMLMLTFGALNADHEAAGKVKFNTVTVTPKPPTPLGTPPAPSPTPVEPELNR